MDAEGFSLYTFNMFVATPGLKWDDDELERRRAALEAFVGTDAALLRAMVQPLPSAVVPPGANVPTDRPVRWVSQEVNVTKTQHLVMVATIGWPSSLPAPRWDFAALRSVFRFALGVLAEQPLFVNVRAARNPRRRAQLYAHADAAPATHEPNVKRRRTAPVTWRAVSGPQ